MARIPTDRIIEALAREELLIARVGILPTEISAITDDSRAVVDGGAFVAVRGSGHDGHAFLGAAERAGAVLAIVEREGATSLPALVVRDGRRAAGLAAAAFYAHPACELRLVGVTGTNGKTTTVAMLRHLLDAPDARAASIGTIGVLIGSEGAVVDGGGGLTTPGPIELQRVLRLLADRGVGAVSMEVSSHALEQRRVEGMRFDAAVFTNLTRDHLDYHGTMEAYLAAKSRLVEHLVPHGALVVNADDPAWETLPLDRRRVRFSTRVDAAEVHATSLRFDSHGSAFTLVIGSEQAEVQLPLVGDFNVANALAAASAAFALGFDAATIAARLSSLPQVPGRLEMLHDAPTVLRDYAHTPDALERALDAVRPFATGRLLVVFGCGGDRDRGKRPEMGRIASRRADYTILTSDNPRSEDPERILDDIATGMEGAAWERIEDRRSAIGRALSLAGPADVVLLAGKGHETYQIRGTERFPFDEAAIVQELVAALSEDDPRRASTPLMESTS